MTPDFEAIYRLYFTSVYHFLLRRTKDPDLADEITSLTFFKALESLDSYRGDGSIDGWLKQIAYRLFLDHLSRSAKTVSDEPLEQWPSDEPSPEEAVIEQEALQAIEQTMYTLPSPYREVFQLRVIQDKSYQDIGRLFHKSENWACVTFHRAKRMIQNQMEEKS